MNHDRIAWQNGSQQLRPLDEAQTSALEVVLYAKIERVLYLIKAIAIEVIDEFARLVRSVLVDNGEGGTIDYIRYAQLLAYGLDECRLARSHGGMKGKDRMISHPGDEVMRCTFEVGSAIDDDSVHNMEGGLFRLHGYHRHEHFFERYASVLESIAIVLHVVIVVIGIGEEIILLGEDKFIRQVVVRKPYALGVVDLEYLLGVVVQIFAHLVAEVGICISVSYHSDGVLHLDGTVVCRQHHLVSHLGDALEKVVSD